MRIGFWLWMLWLVLMAAYLGTEDFNEQSRIACEAYAGVWSGQVCLVETQTKGNCYENPHD